MNLAQAKIETEKYRLLIGRTLSDNTIANIGRFNVENVIIAPYLNNTVPYMKP
jgi:hypothetical protein